MIKKIGKPLLLSGIIVAALAGCTNDKEIAPGKDNSEKDATQQVATKQFNYNNYYNLKDDKAIVEMNGKKLTVGELKRKAFEQLMLTEVNQFVERQLLLNKYPVSDEALKKELKEKYANVQSIDKEQLRFQLSYDKAIREGVSYTDTDLKKIYNENFSKSGRSYSEMKKELEQMAPYYLGAQIYDKIAKLREDANLKFIDSDVEKQYNTVYPTHPDSAKK